MSTSHDATPDAGPDPRRDEPTRALDRDPRDPTLERAVLGRRAVVQAEQQQFGGIKIGSAFFGWLTATGTALLLTALVVAAGGDVGLALGADGAAAGRVSADVGTVTLAGGIALLVVLFVAYYCGGYVAGRMARFNGARQGLAVWVWALVIAAVVAVVGVSAGSEFNLLATLNSFPRIPIGEGELSNAGILAAAGVAVTSLVGAVAGGLAGMRFHRKVDRAGLGD